MHDKLFSLLAVRGKNVNVAPQGELKRILCQIDQYLLESDLVSVELIRQIVIRLLMPSRLCQASVHSWLEWSFGGIGITK